MKVMDKALDRMEARAGAPKRKHAKGTAVAGVVVMVIAAVGYFQPGVIFNGSVSQVRGVCSSLAGELAQSVSPATQSSCTEVSTVTTVIVVAALLGLVMVLFGLRGMSKAGA